MVTGLFTEEQDGLFSDWHEENIIWPVRALMLGVSNSPGLKSHPAGWIASLVSFYSGLLISGVMIAEKKVFEPYGGTGNPFLQGVWRDSKRDMRHNVRRLQKEFKTNKKLRRLFRLSHDLRDDISIEYEDDVFSIQYNPSWLEDFGVGIEYEKCQKSLYCLLEHGHTGECLPDFE